MRLIWADVFKGVLILLVILGHAIQYRYGDDCFDNKCWCVIYSFHMPCFFAISGYFATGSIDNFRKLCTSFLRRFMQLIVPMVCWAIIIYPPRQFSIMDILCYFDCGSFWFLWALFFICIIYNLSVYFKTITNIPSWIIHLLVVSALTSVMFFINYREHGFHYITYFYPFYLLGFYIKRWEKKNVFKKGNLLIGLLIWLLCSFFWKMHEIPVIMPNIPLPNSLIIYLYRYFTGFVAVISFVGLFSLIINDKICKNYIIVAFEYIGGLSLGIYTVHLGLFKLFRNYIFILDNNTIAVFFSFTVISFVSVCLISLIRINNVLSMLLLGKINK